jgi:hypothetical protein
MEDGGAVKLKVIKGKQADVDKYMEKYGAQAILTRLGEQLQQRTGMFSRTIQSANLPDAPEAGFLGWGLSVGGGYANIKDKSNIEFEYDLQFTREHELEFGASFANGGKQFEQYTKNLTHTNIPFPTSDDYKKRAEEEAKAIERGLKKLKDWRQMDLISEEEYQKLKDELLKQGAFSKFAI